MYILLHGYKFCKLVLTYSFAAALLASIARRIEGGISSNTCHSNVDTHDVSGNESDGESVASVVLSYGSDDSDGEKDATLSTLKRPRSADFVGRSKAPAIDEPVNAVLTKKRNNKASKVLQMLYRDSMQSAE